MTPSPKARELSEKLISPLFQEACRVSGLDLADKLATEHAQAIQDAVGELDATPPCPHDEEEDYCDGCRFAYEHRMAEANTRVRTALKPWLPGGKEYGK